MAYTILYTIIGIIGICGRIHKITFVKYLPQIVGQQSNISCYTCLYQLYQFGNQLVSKLKSVLYGCVSIKLKVLIKAKRNRFYKLDAKVKIIRFEPNL